MLLLVALVLSAGCLRADDWLRFRGPNGTGVSAERGLSGDLSPAKRLWRVAVAPGHSSPVVRGDRIFLTGIEDDRLVTFCLRRKDGALLWKKEAPRARREIFDKRNNAASPTVTAEDGNLYVFFPEFGLLSYTVEGKERWRLPLGPFDNFYGMGASPIVAGDNIILICDQSRGSFAVGVGKEDGKVKWRQARAEAVSGHSTPVVYRKGQGPLTVLAPGSFRMDAYQASTGELLWHAKGLASEMKSVPVVDGDRIYINGYNLPENDPGRQIPVSPFAEMIRYDRNANGGLEKEEMPEGRAKSFFEYLDLNRDQKLDGEEWQLFAQGMAAENSLLAIEPGGKVVWKVHRAIPQLPSTLLYEGVLYMISDGGILSTLDPKDGALHKQGRLRAAPDRMYASPVAGDGKIYFVTQAGVAVVMAAGPEQRTLSVADLEEEVYATPAISGGMIFIRTSQALHAFRP
ncbi:MAG: PQQ-binding-like beta-propeller repeat protein [Bryobacterales bacterium]|nr:PQQ-binding-like beta-propeller repeat protein [Bryobacterales bacterium]